MALCRDHRSRGTPRRRTEDLASYFGILTGMHQQQSIDEIKRVR